MIIYQISLHGDAYDARDKDWDQMYAETGCKPRTEWLDPIYRRTLLKGEFGCSVSHYRVWQKIAESGLNGIILEEDAVFSEINPSHADWMLEDHDSVWLGYRWNDMGYWYNCHAYAITPETAKLLIEDFHNNIIPVDEWIPEKLKDKRNYFYPKEVVTQIPRSTRPSTIEDTDMLPDPKLHIVTVGTDDSKMWALKQSAEKFGVAVTNFGKGSDWYDPMEGHAGMPKIKMVFEGIQDFNDDDVVLFMDAYDTMLLKDPKEILERFLGFKTDILFGAEKNFWPDSPFLQTKFDDKFEGELYKYLNSGLYIGYVKHVKSFLSRGAWLSDKAVNADDQQYCQAEFMSLKNRVSLDHEAYVFQNDEPSVTKVGVELLGPICAPCIYHGNGDFLAKVRFQQLANQFGYYEPISAPAIAKPSYEEVPNADILIVPLLTQSECRDLIDLSEELGTWGSMSGDKFPAQEIRLKELGLKDVYEQMWVDTLAPICEEYWSPVQYMGLRDAFTMRYSTDTQKSLGLHTDASLITGSVKLNDNYEGATLHFPRQKFSNLKVPVGSCILFPAQVTHGHYVDELKSGVKYSLTMWTSRYEGDIN